MLRARTFIHSLVVGTSLLLASPALRADPPTRDVVVRELSGFETAPTVAAVRAWGTPGATLLMDIANDPSALHHVRARAVHALRAFNTSVPIHAFLRAFAAAPNQGLFLLRAALDAMVEGFDDVPEVSRYLRDARVDVRDGAAWSLSQSTSAAARAALDAALRTETDPTVRATLQRALAPRTAR